MNTKLILLAVAVALIGAGALMMCDDSDAAAGDVLKSGSCGTSLTYEVRSLNADDSQFELIISGNGDMVNWSAEGSQAWLMYRNSIIQVSLPEGLTHIGENAFYGCKALALTELPAGITSIGASAFSGCTVLALTELPAGLTSINDAAFQNCKALALTELPAGITSIGEAAFNGCPVLALTSLPVGLTSIGQYAFDGCTVLALTELPAGLTSISAYAFRKCSALALTELPAGLTSIDQYAFALSKKINNLTMPALNLTVNTGLQYLESLTYSTTGEVWTAANVQYSPQYLSMATLQSITFSDDRIPSFALYGQNLDTLTITNASGDDFLGIYTAPNTKATASALTVDGTAGQIVRLTDVAGAAELVDGGITANDAFIHWNTTPDGYATGEVKASPEILIYPAGIHSSEPNEFGGLLNAIPLLVIISIVMAIVGMMVVRRD